MYDFLIVGAGLFGATLAERLTKHGKKVLIVEKKNHVGGTVYTEVVDNIHVHKYGAHIFHTNDVDIWNYVNKFCPFKYFINTPIAIHNGVAYNLPFNMNTFAKLWNITLPEEAMSIIDNQIKSLNLPDNPITLEDYAKSKVGVDIYDAFVKEYTEKQWNTKCSDLPKFIISRLPLRFTYNNNYFNDTYQGIPVNGYTDMIHNQLISAEVIVGVDGKQFIHEYPNIARSVIYTGSIDEYYDYKFGKLDYRSLQFEHKRFNVPNKQGVAVVNWSDKQIPYTRSIEHKHFLGEGDSTSTIVSYEYSVNYSVTGDPYYPINTERNNALYKKYSSISSDVIFAGRLGKYKYYNMDEVIKDAILLSDKLL